MIVIGIAGGIASGKSTVGEMFSELGAIVLNADQAGHTVLLSEAAKEQIRQAFGDHVFNDDGEVDRKTLASIVFDSDDAALQLKKLEQITHPLIRKLLEQRIDAIKSSGETTAVVLDAPVMFKSGWSDFCDVIVFVDVPIGLRRERANGRGWTQGELDRRERLQTPLQIKRQRSDLIVENTGSPEEVRCQIEKVWRQILTSGKHQTKT